MTTTTSTSPAVGDKVKEIGWAYPSSSSAVKFGFGRTGCFVLSVGIWPNPLKAINASACVEDLQTIAEDKTEYQWSPYSAYTAEGKQ